MRAPRGEQKLNNNNLIIAFVEQLHDFAVVDSDDRRSPGRHDIDRLVRPSAAADLIESVG